jgi:hypothetical protein
LFGHHPAAQTTEEAIAQMKKQGATIVDKANIPTLGTFRTFEQDEVAKGPCLPKMSDEPSLVQVMPRGRTAPESSITFRKGCEPSGSTIQIKALALPGTPTAASRLPSGAHARNPFVSAGPSGSVEYSASPRLFTNFRYVRPGPRGSRCDHVAAG